MSRIIHLLVGLVLFLTIEQNCYALSWNDLWYNSNQQAAKLLKQHPESAAKLFSDSRWQGVAYFNSHDYQAAAGSFATDKTSDGFYNQGNALAYQNNYPGAIKAYQEALKLNPQNQDAQYNLDLIKKLQQQQQQQSPQDQKNSQSSQNQQNSQSSADSKNKNSAGNKSDSNSSPGKSPENKAGQPPQNLANQAAKNNSTGTPKSGGQSAAQSGNSSSTNQGTKELAQSQPASQSGSSNGAAPQNNNIASKSQTNPNNSPTAAGSHPGKALPPNQPSSQQLQAAGNKSNNNPANTGGVVATVGNSNQKMTPEDREVAAVLSQIPDDPGGLLRNKFLRDYQNQSAQGSNNGQ